jgi:hypothetical protein
MKVYRGTPIKKSLIKKGCYVSQSFSRASSYARYPNNGPGNQIGYIYELEVAESDVNWETERIDCCQGVMKKDVLAKRIVICDVQLDVENRQPPVHISASVITDMPDKFVWADKKQIEWISVDQR